MENQPEKNMGCFQGFGIMSPTFVGVQVTLNPET